MTFRKTRQPGWIYPKDNLVYDIITTNFADKIKSMEG